MSINLSALQKQRRDTAANWTAENPTLLAGEIGLESDTGYWKVGDGATAWTSLAYVTGLGAEIPVSRLADGTARQLLQTAANGNDVEWTSNVDVPGTLDVTGAATFDAAVTIQGDLTVNGTTTTIDTQNLIVEDKNVIIGNVTTPTDVTADGGGITLKGTTDKTINWVDATDAWTLSEHVNIASGKEYRIDGTKVLDANSLGSSVLITSANITDGTIVNGDINASAAIAGTKISPDFGSQNVTTTGTSTAASFIPTSSTAPTNGLYLSAANSVGISTNSTGRLFIDSSGNVGVGGSVGFGAIDHGIHVTGSGAQEGIRLQTSAGSSGILEVYAESGGATLDTRGSGYIRFNNATTEWARFDSSGRLGIGSSTPVNKLDVNGSISAAGSFSNTGYAPAVHVGLSGGNPTIASGNNVTSTYLPLVFTRETTTGSAESMRIDASGRLGIGTTSPAGRLHVSSSGTGTSAGSNIVISARSEASGRDAAIQFADGTTSAYVGMLSGAIYFADAGSTERARIDSSGRLLVGTSTARENFYNTSGVTVQLQVEGAGNSTRSAIVTNSNDTSGSQILLAKSRSSSVGGNSIVSSGDALGLISFQGADGTEFVEAARIFAEVDGTPGANDMPGRLVFSTTADGAASPTERVRIDSSGRVNIGNNQGSMDSNADDLVLGTGSGNNGMTIYSGLTGIGAINFANGNSGTNRYQGILFYDHNAQELCAATDTGNTRWRTGSTGFYPNADNNIPLGKSGARWSAVWAANGTIQTSDQREKTEITDSALGINFVKTLRPVSYKWIEGGKVQVDGERDTYEPVPGTRTHWGFIAQEVKQAVDAAGVDFGGWVLTDKDDPDSQQALRYDQFIAPLTKALQEALEKIETLEAKVAALESA